MFAVTVEITLEPGRMEAFMPLMRANAQASMENEPACHRFDVCTDSAKPDTVFLYELYTDAAAFQAHLQMPHFKRFDAAVAEMIAAKDIQTFDRVQS